MKSVDAQERHHARQRSRADSRTGRASLGGMVTTGGGVTFLSSTLDYYIRGYDVSNGKVLWKARLPAGGQATPMSYVSNKSGRQFVVVMAGGPGSLGTNERHPDRVCLA